MCSFSTTHQICWGKSWRTSHLVTPCFLLIVPSGCLYYWNLYYLCHVTFFFQFCKVLEVFWLAWTHNIMCREIVKWWFSVGSTSAKVLLTVYYYWISCVFKFYFRITDVPIVNLNSEKITTPRSLVPVKFSIILGERCVIITSTSLQIPLIIKGH